MTRKIEIQVTLVAEVDEATAQDIELYPSVFSVELPLSQVNLLALQEVKAAKFTSYETTNIEEMAS